jgi:hypothetical protein
MIDKLAANAVDFATADPIDVSLERNGETAVLRVSNTGPLLPAEMGNACSNRWYRCAPSARRRSRISVSGFISCARPPNSMAAALSAMDRADGSGVTFELRFPLAA